jgi:hypothetical protein
MLPELNAANGLIFRIIHRDNIPWILDNGLHCRNSKTKDPKFVQIGNDDLISKRRYRAASGPYGGLLSDYIPFYFTPLSPMFYNIKTGWNGITKRSNEEIVICYLSLADLMKHRVQFIFTDRHAYLAAAQVFSDLSDLQHIDWPILQNRDFKRDTNDLGKVERYEAEALVHKFLPVEALRGIACANASVAATVSEQVAMRGLSVAVQVKPNWHF